MAREKKETAVLRGLQYFEAVNRHASLKQAAQDLGVTESAVSHQMRRFSALIGRQLLAKSGRGIVLTATGQEIAAKLSVAFAGVESLVKELVGEGPDTLQLALCSSFGPGWLIERLEDFHDAHPEIDLQLKLYAQDPLISGEVADAFVTAHPVKPDYVSVRLMDEMLIAVHKPSAKHGGRHRLITTWLDKGHIGEEWGDFCKASGLKLAELQDGSFRQCTHYLFALEMAKSGQGVALVPDFLAARDIAAGTLTAFSRRLVPSGRVYRLCYRKSRAHEAQLVALRDWLLSRMAETPARRRKARSPAEIQNVAKP
jgi:LysR family transcriptional regulator, glycine cleavage system transcriptional activator